MLIAVHSREGRCVTLSDTMEDSRSESCLEWSALISFSWPCRRNYRHPSGNEACESRCILGTKSSIVRGL